MRARPFGRRCTSLSGGCGQSAVPGASRAAEREVVEELGAHAEVAVELEDRAAPATTSPRRRRRSAARRPRPSGPGARCLAVRARVCRGPGSRRRHRERRPAFRARRRPFGRNERLVVRARLRVLRRVLGAAAAGAAPEARHPEARHPEAQEAGAGCCCGLRCGGRRGEQADDEGRDGRVRSERHRLADREIRIGVRHAASPRQGRAPRRAGRCLTPGGCGQRGSVGSAGDGAISPTSLRGKPEARRAAVALRAASWIDNAS